MKQVRILQYKQGELSELNDLVADELEFRLVVDDRYVRNIQTSGYYLEELVVGHLLVKGIVRTPEEIGEVQIGGDEILVYLKHLNLHKPENESAAFQLPDYAKLLVLMKEFELRSHAFRKTGAMHAAGIATESGIEVFREDISRQNAVEMLIGNAAIHDISLKGKLILLSCRVTRQIAERLIAVGASCIISRSAVSFAALDLCRRNDICLIGFARLDRLNVYHMSNP
jgi:FdhD protein